MDINLNDVATAAARNGLKIYVSDLQKKYTVNQATVACGAALGGYSDWVFELINHKSEKLNIDAIASWAAQGDKKELAITLYKAYGAPIQALMHGAMMREPSNHAWISELRLIHSAQALIAQAKQGKPELKTLIKAFLETPSDDYGGSHFTPYS